MCDGLVRCIIIYMSFILRALRDKPVALYGLDDSSPFQDYSGYGRSASATGGTPATSVSLARGAQYSTVFSNTVQGTFESPVFKAGTERDSFSLEVWARVSTPSTSGQLQILGNQGQMDGLTINGTTIGFSTKYSDSSEAKATHDIQVARTVHIVGVHTFNANYLYVDGELVDEVSISDVQQSLSFAGTGGTLYSGITSTSMEVALNSVAIYSYALNGDIVAEHYDYGRDLPDADAVASSFGGDEILVSLTNSTKYMSETWDTEREWNLGVFSNTSIVNDELRPQFEGDVSLPGQWTGCVALDSSPTTLFAATATWSGEGAVVDVSLDNTTWTTIQRGVNIPLITPGFDPTGQQLLVRVSFPGGIADDESYFDWIEITLVKSGTTPSYSGRTLTLSGVSQKRDYTPLELSDDWGAYVASSGTITISADQSSAAVPVRTLELWIKRTSSSTAPTISVSGTMYQNGAANSSALVTDRWTLMHIVAPSDVTGTVTITGPAQVGQVSVYSSALSAGNIQDIYNQYVGNTRVPVIDSSTIQVSEPAAAANIYASDWSIIAAG